MKPCFRLFLLAFCAIALVACDLQSRIVSATGGNSQQPTVNSQQLSDLYGVDSSAQYGTDTSVQYGDMWIGASASEDTYGRPTIEYANKNDYVAPRQTKNENNVKEETRDKLPPLMPTPHEQVRAGAPVGGAVAPRAPMQSQIAVGGHGATGGGFVSERKDSPPSAPVAPLPPKGGENLTPMPAPPAPPPVTEPDDILLVPAKIAHADKKVEIVAPMVGEIIVEKGDTVYGLSRKHNVPLRDLLDANDLKPPYAISPGQKLRLPSLRVHTVVAGDTLYSISRAYSVDLHSLAAENNIAPPYGLAVGQKLRLPASIAQPQAAQSVLLQTQSIDNAKIEADKKAAEAKELTRLQAEKQKIEEEKKRLDAEKKKIEDEKTRAATEKQKQEAEKKRIDAEKQKAELDKKAKAADAKIKEQKQKITSTPTSKLPAANARTSTKFSWPVQGKIISDFGAKKNGLYNDGINIAAKLGTPVRAAENGVVAYAGNELKGMGNLVIIQHTGGWMTVYAHMDMMNVRRGAKVSVGEKIGTVGETGKVSESQLHFEIRNGTKAYNPRTQLK